MEKVYKNNGQAADAVEHEFTGVSGLFDSSKRSLNISLFNPVFSWPTTRGSPFICTAQGTLDAATLLSPTAKHHQQQQQQQL